MPRISKVDKVAQASNVIRGVSTRLKKRKKYLVAGTLYSQKDLLAFFQSHLDAIRAAESIRATYAAAVMKEQELARRATALVQGLKLAVYIEHGLAAGAWGDFGWEAPKKRGPKTLAGKVRGARKRKATRENG